MQTAKVSPGMVGAKRRQAPSRRENNKAKSEGLPIKPPTVWPKTSENPTTNQSTERICRELY